jgi:hypothetical protein
VAAEREVAVDPVQQRRQPQLVELRHLVAPARLELETGQRRATPERERSAETLGCGLELTLRGTFARACNEQLHAVGIELVRRHLQAVAAGRGRDRISAGAAERLANFREVDVDRLVRSRRRRFPPQIVDQALARDELVRIQEQNAEDEPLLHCPERDRLSGLDHLERPEDTKLHRAVLPLFHR